MAASQPSPVEHMHTALIVEDLTDAAEWLRDTLRQAFAEIRVTIAYSVEEALARLHDQRFDLALIDLQLPDGSGLEVIDHINARPGDTLCVVASIFDDDEHIFPALQSGARGYLLKERPQAELVEELRGIVAGRPPLSPAIARRLLVHFQGLKPDNAVHLTPRETEVLRLVGKGIRLADIGDMLHISRHTAADYVKSIYRKLNISSRAEAAVEAMRRGLI